jgi:CheY-like chemotaxis protein
MSIRILWADDEIDMLKPQLLFLEGKGYEVRAVTNGQDAVDSVEEDNAIDIVFLDENMPGLSGLETLSLIKERKPELPVVMITKNEAEDLMEEAIGQQITDYLIKPVKPQQILLTLKKIIDQSRLVSEKTNASYQQDFQNIFSQLHGNLDAQGWSDIYKKLSNWEIELDRTQAGEMREVLGMQKQEANVQFSKFISQNYLDWIADPDAEGVPTLSHNLMEREVFPILKENVPTFLLVIDNLRLDQYRIIQPMLSKFFRVEEEKTYYSILPTSTQYARNSIFAGVLPVEIQRRMPKLWKNDWEEGGKNLHEQDFLVDNLSRHRLSIKHSYNKITNHAEGRNLEDNMLNLLHNDLNVIVYNFVDMLSHARTEMEVLKELASDERAYRSLTESWFTNSPLLSALRKLEGKDVQIVLTTDHGTMRVKQPSKVVGDRNTTTNLRYKSGKNLNYNSKEVFEVRQPEEAGLPRPNVSSAYIFARQDSFFVYPNNYNYYVNFFRDTFQHGGISLEEMIIPLARFSSK